MTVITLSPMRERLANGLAAARERKAARCDEMAEAHAYSRHALTYRLEAAFWRDAAAVARAGDLTPMSFEVTT